MEVYYDETRTAYRIGLIACFCNGLSIYDDGKEVACGFIGEVLRSVVHLADREIESCNTFFDVFVIRLKKK